MGNNQSNIRKENWKTFRICRREEHSRWFRCYLDDYVSYNNGREKRIDFEDETGAQKVEFVMGILGMPMPVDTPFLREGDYIQIDMNYTNEYSSGHEFSARSIRKVGFESVDSEGNVSIFKTAANVANDILEARQRYAKQAEYNRWSAQTESWTSYNLPPR